MAQMLPPDSHRWALSPTPPVHWRPGWRKPELTQVVAGMASCGSGAGVVQPPTRRQAQGALCGVFFHSCRARGTARRVIRMPACRERLSAGKACSPMNVCRHEDCGYRKWQKEWGGPVRKVVKLWWGELWNIECGGGGGVAWCGPNSRIQGGGGRCPWYTRSRKRWWNPEWEL